MTPYQFTLLKTALPVAAAIFIALATVSIWLCWSPTLGPIAEHRAVMFRAVIRAMQRDLSTAHTYWAWLNRHGLVALWVARVVLPALLSAGLSAWFFTWYMGQSEVRHVKGPIPLDGAAALRHARANYRREVSVGKPGLHVHPAVQLTEKREVGNLIVSGVAGAGKSVIEKSMVEELIARGDRAFIYDQKSEYLPIFYDAEYVVIISPADFRSHYWYLSHDCQTEEEARMVAENFLPMPKDVKDPVWINGARAILSGCIIALQNLNGTHWGWRELREALSTPDSILHSFLLPHAPEAASLIDPRGGSQTTASYRSTIFSNLTWLTTMARAWPHAGEKPFSIRQWLTNPNSPRIVIVPNNPEFSAVSAPLCTALISLLVAKVLAMSDSNERKIWLVLDELANLPKSPSILKWLELGRSKGARMLAGFQSYSQIQDLYGEKSAQTLLGLFHTVLSMRCGQAGGSSEIVSNAFGKRQVKRLSLTDSGNGTTSTNWQTVDEPVVRAEELEHLPQPGRAGVTGYLSVAGWNAVYRLTWPYKNIPKVAEEFVAADWVRKAKKDGKTSGKCVDSRTVRVAHGSTSGNARATKSLQKNNDSSTEISRTRQTVAPQSRLRRSPQK